jgi:uncharacterized protein
MTPRRIARPYADPYLAGIGLGAVLLLAFIVAGRGLGASGAFASSAAAVTAMVAPSRAAASPVFDRYLEAGGLWQNWLVFEIFGVMVGGFASAWLAGRWRFAVESGAHIGRGLRLTLAAAGGALMGVGAVLARGCTSGLALSGGALLSVGSWAFMTTAFLGGYLAAPLTRRAWQ